MSDSSTSKVRTSGKHRQRQVAIVAVIMLAFTYPNHRPFCPLANTKQLWRLNLPTKLSQHLISLWKLFLRSIYKLILPVVQFFCFPYYLLKFGPLTASAYPSQAIIHHVLLHRSRNR